MTVRRLFSIAVTFLLLFSCEEPIDLQLGESEPELVVSSNFFPETTIKVDVSATQSIVGEVNRQIRITDARVIIFEGNNMMEALSYEVELQRYVSRDLIPVSGREYTIHVSADGFTPVSAVSSIPEQVKIKSLLVDALNKETGVFTIYDYLLQLDFDDDPEEVNFYDLRIRQSVTPFEIAFNGDTIFKEPFYKAPLNNNREGGASASLLFQDKPVAIGPVLLRLQSQVDPGKELLGEIVAELRTVSPEYYKFRRSLIREQQQPGGGISQPVLLFNNFSEGGIGIFAGYNRDVARAMIRH